MTSKKMFSDYSWWDFIKVALALAVPYYAFVIGKYYREDIREWLSNRGEKGEKKPSTQSDAPAEDIGKLTKGLFDVQTYAPVSAPAEEPVAPPATAVPEPPVSAPAPAPPVTQPITPPVVVADRPVITNEVPANSTLDEEDQEADGLLTDGPTVVADAPVVIHIDATLVAPAESSLKDIVEAGQHLQKQENGLVTAPDDDQAGNVLAGYINKQQQKKAAGLEGISFNRR